jgi:hypothetical protein
VTGIGQDADVATKMLQGMGAQLVEVRKQSTQPTAEASGVTVLRGGAGTAGGLIQLSGAANQAVQIFRGGVQPIKDFTKPLEALNLDLSHIPTGKLGDLQRLNEILTEFVRVSKTLDPTALNILSKALFGIASSEAIRAAPALLENLNRQIAELQKTSRGATDDALKQDEALRASKDKLATSWSESMASLAQALTPAQTNINNMFVEILNAWGQMREQFLAQSSATWTAFLAGVQTAADGFKSIWATVIEWFSNAISTAVSAAKSAASSVSSVLSGGGGQDFTPFASGGLVRGSGGATSDSILARLSNGEFVMRAQAVQHWGPQFLASLNGLRNPGFALGGLVSSLPRFAEGGLAAGGTPVHLHLGGNSFALAGHDSVVSALVVEAHRQQMRSAGTKPSWFAARPSGR